LQANDSNLSSPGKLRNSEKKDFEGSEGKIEDFSKLS